MIALAVVIRTVVALLALQAAAPMKTIDTGLGFTISVPEAWQRGQPYKNNKFVMGGGDEDFAVVVSDFGPAQADPAGAHAVYRESFAKAGLTIVSERQAEGGKAVKQYVLRLETPDGPGHAEAALVEAGGETYAVVVVTPEAAAAARRETIAKILDSITVR
jgi:hypothetical protein